MPVLGRSPSSSPYPIVRRAIGTSTNPSSGTSTLYVDIDTTTDVTIPATAGDWLAIEPNWVWTDGPTAVIWADAVTVVANTPVNYCSGRGSSGIGYAPWFRTDNAMRQAAAGALWYQVQTADLSGGTVTTRLRMRSNAASASQINSDANWKITNQVTNFGPGTGPQDWSTFIVTKTAAYSANVGEMVLANAVSAGFTVTLPATPIIGAVVTVKKIDASTNIVTVVGSGVTTIDGDPTGLLVSQWTCVSFVYDGTNWLVRAAYGEGSSTSTYASYTPVLTAVTTNPTLGSGSVAEGQYMSDGSGKRVTGDFHFTFGTSMNPGSGEYRISLPVNADTTMTSVIVGHALVYDSSGVIKGSVDLVRQTATTCKILVDAGSAFYVTHSVPWTWATSDEILGTLLYRAA